MGFLVADWYVKSFKSCLLLDLFFLADRNKSWVDCLEQQCIIGSIEDFIALKYRILPPSHLPLRKLKYMYTQNLYFI